MAEKTQTIAMIEWNARKEGFIKLNTDGACRSNEMAGCEGVIPGSQGEWIRGYAKNIGRCIAFVMKLWRVLEGLRCIRTMRFKKVELNIDLAFVEQVLKFRKFHCLT
ncbi:hypothetical protein L195_g040259 [Trifolium pratense]|uniref:Uncharacterized protein n=1 Tax=Trifolium pratense TaxID=57577 RepID=A0A2K3M0A5_TRIPR|nr:hypothetical protein L195_g040259 [Trifolium pratense]